MRSWWRSSESFTFLKKKLNKVKIPIFTFFLRLFQYLTIYLQNGRILVVFICILFNKNLK